MNTTTSLTASESTTPAVALKPGKPSKKSKANRGADKAPRAAKSPKAARAPKAEKLARKGRKARGEAAPVEAPAAEPVVSDGKPLPMAEVYANPNQPRKLFSQPEIEELAASIAQNGQLQPIKVVPRAQQGGPGKYMIVLGERRWRAHQHLGLATIQATVSEMTDDQVADAAIVENLQRKDITPLEEARAFQARLDTGLTVDELAKRLGMKQSWRITERTALLKLTAEHQEALARGALTPSQAYEMSRLGPAMQQVLRDAISAGKCRSFAELRKTVEALVVRERQLVIPTDVAGAEPPTEAEVARVREIEAMVDKVCDVVQRGFDGNEVVILRKVDVANADALADKLEQIEGQLRQLRLELRAAAVAQATPMPPAEEPAPASVQVDEVSEAPAGAVAA